MEPMSSKPENPIFLFMGIGSLIYAFFYTLFLYQNNSGITYPFFVGGTCLFFFLYLKKSGITAKMFSLFPMAALVLLGISTCLTDSWILLFFNRLMIFFLFFYLVLYNLYDDKTWGLPKYAAAIITVACTSLIYLFYPFTDLMDFCRSKRGQESAKDHKVKYIIWGCGIAFPLLLVVFALLCSADAVFSSIFEVALTKFFYCLFQGNIWGISCTFLFAFFASYCVMSRISRRDIKEEVPQKRTAEPLIGITFTGILSVVYMLFCFIQIVFLFGGFGTLPEGYTYASYAREGFFQLVFVCFINLVLVLACIRYFRPNLILKGILTFISFCTYIMIASSAYRMLLYIDIYCLTFLRVLVLWGLSVIFFLIIGALILIYKEDFPLVRYFLITVTTLYLLFCFSRPDFFIASYNLYHSSKESVNDTSQDYRSGVYNDYYYLKRLSMDAAPVILKNAKAYGYQDSTWFHSYASHIAELTDIHYEDSKSHSSSAFKKPSLRKWNLSRWMAINSFEKYFDSYSFLP